MSDLPSNWGITTPDRLLSNLRVAETGGDMAECADALEWMLRSGRLLHREAIHPLLDAEFLGRAANGLTIAAEGKVWLDKKYCLEQAAVLYEAAAAIGGDEDVSASS